jgi:hypothetical protein
MKNFVKGNSCQDRKILTSLCRFVLNNKDFALYKHLNADEVNS